MGIDGLEKMTMADHPALPDELKCFGCGACANVCPADAITMGYGKGHFLVYQVDSDKCISCGKCEKACPALNPVFDNLAEPDFYAYCASDEIRAQSSSGGMFTSLAQHVIAEGGVVCATAFDEGLKLRHQFFDSMDEIGRFRGSKYLQSDVGDCYKKIGELLRGGTTVMFVGTPCQVAALRGVVGEVGDNLVLVDLLCHGVPSQLFFDSYVEGIAGGKDVVDVSFRDKRFGWSFSDILVSFADGSEYHGTLRAKPKDSYMAAYKGNLMMRDSCYNCQFCDYPRQGDITIGDLWEPAKLDPNSDDRKGTSFVFLNNEKGRRIYGVLEQDAVYSNRIERTKDQYRTIPNRVLPTAKPHAERKRFLELFGSKPFDEAFDQAVNHTYDIGLPTVFYGENIGSVLTYWSMYHVLSDLGYSVKPFEKPYSAPLKDHPLSVDFAKKWLPSWAVPKRYATQLDMRVLNSSCNQFVVGSDQVFLENMSNIRKDIFFLQYVAANRNKVAYASSFGGPGGRGSKDYYEHLKYYLDKFDAISCREDDGVSFANETLKLRNKVEFALDPVFLCAKDHFMQLVDSTPARSGDPFIGAYIVKPRDRVLDLIGRASNGLGFTQVECHIHKYDKAKVPKFQKFSCSDSFPLEETLRTLYDCDYIITDSYHGVCFALIFEKDFLAIPRDFPDRFTSLLKRLGLEDRIVADDLSNYSEDLLRRKIDYAEVRKLLLPLIESSRSFLESALAKPRTYDGLSDFDAAMDILLEQEKAIRALTKRVKQLESDNSGLESLEKRVAKIERRWAKVQATVPFRLYRFAKRKLGRAK